MAFFHSKPSDDAPKAIWYSPESLTGITSPFSSLSSFIKSFRAEETIFLFPPRSWQLISGLSFFRNNWLNNMLSFRNNPWVLDFLRFYLFGPVLAKTGSSGADSRGPIKAVAFFLGLSFKRKGFNRFLCYRQTCPGRKVKSLPPVGKALSLIFISLVSFSLSASLDFPVSLSTYFLALTFSDRQAGPS